MNYNILFLVIILFSVIFILERTKNKISIFVLGNLFIYVLLMIMIGIVFVFSEYYYNAYSIAPYNLTYSEVLASVTSIVSFIGGTLVAALGLYFTVTSKQKNNQDKSE